MGGRNEQRGGKKMNVQNAMQEIKRGKKKKSTCSAALLFHGSESRMSLLG